MTKPTIPAEWAPAVEAILESGGLVVVVGAVDTGKTTFVRILASHAVAAGMPVGLVDADIGQSEIGPPTCVSLAMPDGEFESLSTLRAIAMGFVGSISPQWCIPEHLAETCRIVDLARAKRLGMVICDTTGLADAPWSERLKRAKIEALQPDHVVLLRRGQPARILERLLAAGSRPALHSVDVPSSVVVKPPASRAQRRAWRISRALEGGTLHEWPLEELTMENTWLGTGNPLPPPALAQLSREMAVETIYGESIGSRLGLVVRGELSYDRASEVASRLYGAQYVSMTQETSLQGLVVGLHDGARRLLNIGLLQELNRVRRTITIYTPLVTRVEVRSARLGYVRFAHDGRVLGWVRPGEV